MFYEILGTLDSPESFLILMVHYRITDDSGKITEKADFNENLTSAHWVKLHH